MLQSIVTNYTSSYKNSGGSTFAGSGLHIKSNRSRHIFSPLIPSTYTEIEGKHGMVLGGSQAWNIYRNGGLHSSLMSLKHIAAVSIITQTSLSDPFISFTCNDVVNATLIVNTIVNAAFATQAGVQIECGGTMWLIKNCVNNAITSGGRSSSNIAVCANCSNLLYSGSSSGKINDICNSSLSQLPVVGTYPLNCGYSASLQKLSQSCLRMMVAEFIDLNPAASIVSFRAKQITRTLATVSLATTGFSYVSCLANSAKSMGYPKSVDEVISSSKFTNFTDGSNRTTITIYGLNPASAYTIYCATQSSSGSLMPYQSMIDNALDVTTKCCKVVTVSLSNRIITSGVNHVNFVTVSLDSKPSFDITVYVFVQPIPLNVSTPSYCNYLPLSSIATYNKSTLVPNLVQFNGTKNEDMQQLSSSSSNPTVGYLSLPRQSVSAFSASYYQLSVLINGTSRSEYNVEFWPPLPPSFTSSKAPSSMVYPANPKYFGLNVSSTLFIMLPPGGQPPPLSFVAAQFATDGLSVVVRFSYTTDRAKCKFSSFNCAQLLNFPGVSDASCSWSDDSASIMIIPRGLQRISVNDVISLANSSAAPNALTLKPSCPPNSLLGPLTQANCNNAQWSAMVPSPSNYIVVTAPDVVILPSVSLTFPSTVDKCTAVVIDYSGSTGSYGRPWVLQQSSIIVQSSLSQDSPIFLSELSWNLTAQLRGSGTVTLKTNKLVSGGSYIITLTLANFLGGIASGSRTLYVSPSLPAPFISIVGSNKLTMKSSSPLLVSTLIYLTPFKCNTVNGTNSVASSPEPLTSSLSSQNLQLSWTVTLLSPDGNSLKDTFLFRLQSTSNNPMTFKLPSYSLYSGNVYIIKATLSNTISFASSSAAVRVSVQSSNLVAIISGGQQRSVQSGSYIYLDASSSYDPDLPANQRAFSEPTRSYSFTWRCSTLSPTLSNGCPPHFQEALDDASTSDKPWFAILNPRANDTAGLPDNSVFFISLLFTSTSLSTATSASSVRSASTNQTLFIIQSDNSVRIPIVQINSAPDPSQKFNTNNPLTILASVNTFWRKNQTTSCNMQWSSAQFPVSSALEQVSQTPITVNHVATYGSFFAPVNLVIGAHSLVEGAYYTFTLTCYSSRTNQPLGFVSVSVITNAPPTPGYFTVDPPRGLAMKDTFTFAASLWEDDDLPLSYSFAIQDFASPASPIISVRSKDASNSYATTLPPGNSMFNYKIRGISKIYDIFSCNNSATYVFYVNDSIHVTSFISNISTLTSSFQDAAGNPKSLLNIVALTAFIANLVPCTRNCALLYHRQSCSVVPEVCGACLSGYVGQPGNANTACVLASRTQLQFNSTSSTSLSLFHASEMSRSLSSSTTKECPADTNGLECSGSGTCITINTDTGKTVTTYCNIFNVSCSVECVCDAGYYGQTCAYTAAELQHRKNVRDLIFSGFDSALSAENLDTSSISEHCASLVAFAQDPYQISDKSVGSLRSIMNILLAAAVSIDDTPIDSILPLTTTIDTLSQAVYYTYTQNTTSYAKNFTNGYDAAREASTEYFRILSSIIASNLVSGQDAVDYIGAFSRVTTKTISVLTGGMMKEALTDLEKLAFSAINKQGTVVSVTPQSSTLPYKGNKNLYLNMVVTKSYLYSFEGVAWNKFTGTSVNANPTRAEVLSIDSPASYSYSSTSPLAPRLIFSFENLHYMDSLKRPAIPEFLTTCLSRRIARYSYSCPGDQPNITVLCNGTAGTIISRCPVYFHESLCQSVTAVGLGTSSGGCYASDYTDLTTTCSCPLPLVNGFVTPSIASSSLQRRRLVSLSDVPTRSIELTTTVALRVIPFPLRFEPSTPPFVDTESFDSRSLAIAVCTSFAILFVTLYYFDKKAFDLIDARSWKATKNTLDLQSWHVESEAEKADASFLSQDDKAGDLSPLRNHGGQSYGKFRVASSQNKTRHKVDVNQPPKLTDTFRNRIRASLPPIFSDAGLISRMLQEFLRHHSWFGVAFHYNEHRSRISRLFACMIEVIINVASISLACRVIYNPALEDKCYQYMWQADCEEKLFSSSVNKDLSVCVWNDYWNTCHMRVPANDATAIAYTSLLALAIAAPFAITAEFFIKNAFVDHYNVLKDENGIEYEGSDEALFAKRKLSSSDAALLESWSWSYTLDHTFIRPIRKVMQRYLSRKHANPVSVMPTSLVDDEEREDEYTNAFDPEILNINDLSTSLQLKYNALPIEQRSDFLIQLDRQLGNAGIWVSLKLHILALQSKILSMMISTNNVEPPLPLAPHILESSSSSSSSSTSSPSTSPTNLTPVGLDTNISNAPTISKSSHTVDDKGTTPFHDPYLQYIETSANAPVCEDPDKISSLHALVAQSPILCNLKQRILLVEKKVKLEADYLKHLCAGDQQRRLLYLFHRDSLRANGPAILDAKYRRDNPSGWSLSLNDKVYITIALLLLSVIMITLSFNWITSQTKDFQALWTTCFVVWFLSEVIFTKSIFVLLLDVLLPLSIYRELKECSNKLIDAQGRYRAMIYEESKSEFDDLLKDADDNNISHRILNRDNVYNVKGVDIQHSHKIIPAPPPSPPRTQTSTTVTASTMTLTNENVTNYPCKASTNGNKDIMHFLATTTDDLDISRHFFVSKRLTSTHPNLRGETSISFHFQSNCIPIFTYPCNKVRCGY